MKKILLSIGVLALLLVGGSVSANNTLWGYYNSAGESLPSISERAVIAAELGVFEYTGTSEQNAELLFRLQNPPPSALKSPAQDGLLGVSVITNYRSQLRSPMTSSQTTVPVASLLTTDGTTITTALLDGVVYLTAAPGASNQEIIKCTAVTATDFTGCTRGLAFSGTSETSVSDNRKPHSAGTVVVMSNVHYVFNRLLDADRTTAQSIASDITFSTGTIYLGDGTTTKNKSIRANNGDANLPFLRYNEGLSQWQFSDDGVNTINFATNTGAGLAASSTAGIGITNSEIFAKLKNNGGLEFDGTGAIGIKFGINSGVGTDANGLFVERGDNFAWTGIHTFDGAAITSTPSANNIVKSEGDGKINSQWLPVPTYAAGTDLTSGDIVKMVSVNNDTTYTMFPTTGYTQGTFPGSGDGECVAFLTGELAITGGVGATNDLTLSLQSYNSSTKAFTQLDTDNSNNISNANGEEVLCSRLSDTKAVFAVSRTDGTDVQGVIVDVTGGNTLAVGGQASVTAGREKINNIYRIDDTHFISFSTEDSSESRVETYVVAGTGITQVDVVTTGNMIQRSGAQNSAFAVPLVGSTSTYIFAGNDDDGADDQTRARVFTVDGSYNVTNASGITLETDTSLNAIVRVTAMKIDGEDVIIAKYRDGGNTRYELARLSISGTTLTNELVQTVDVHNYDVLIPVGPRSVIGIDTSDHMDIFAPFTLDVTSDVGYDHAESNRYTAIPGTVGEYLVTGNATTYRAGGYDWAEAVGLVNQSVASGESYTPTLPYGKFEGLTGLGTARTYYMDEDGTPTDDTSIVTYPAYKAITPTTGYLLLQ